MNALIAKERYHFHERLFETNTLTLTKAGVTCKRYNITNIRISKNI